MGCGRAPGAGAATDRPGTVSIPVTVLRVGLRRAKEDCAPDENDCAEALPEPGRKATRRRSGQPVNRTAGMRGRRATPLHSTDGLEGSEVRFHGVELRIA